MNGTCYIFSFGILKPDFLKHPLAQLWEIALMAVFNLFLAFKTFTHFATSSAILHKERQASMGRRSLFRYVIFKFLTPVIFSLIALPLDYVKPQEHNFFLATHDKYSPVSSALKFFGLKPSQIPPIFFQCSIPSLNLVSFA